MIRLHRCTYGGSSDSATFPFATTISIWSYPLAKVSYTAEFVSGIHQGMSKFIDSCQNTTRCVSFCKTISIDLPASIFDIRIPIDYCVWHRTVIKSQDVTGVREYDFLRCLYFTGRRNRVFDLSVLRI